MTTCSRHLALEIRFDGDRISGRLRDQHGGDWQFSSWLGLLSLIQRLRAGEPSSLTNHPAKEG